MIDDAMFQNRVAPEPVVVEPPVWEEDEQPEQVTFSRVFTYPISGPGLSILSIYAVGPFLLGTLVILATAILPLLAFALGFVVLLVNLLISLSTFWYLTVCIHASAEGQTKAPDVFEFSEDDSLWGWLRGLFFIVLTVSICIAPAFIIKYYAEINNVAFWSILGIGIFSLPMCLLAMVVFDTVNALNPVLIIASISSTFFSYLLVVVLFFVPILLIIGLFFFSWVPLMSVPIRAISLYLLMMDAYLLGRFFYKNEEKLRWDV